MNRLLWAGLLGIAMLFPSTTVDAQSSQAMEQLYGQGVHAYHSGQMQNAMDAFSQAIQLGSRDPRVYYFRGLAQSGTGNSNAAIADYSIGAQLEASSTGRHYDVGRALERVQGGMRLEIENARRNARLTSRSQAIDMGSPNFVDSPASNRPIIPDPLPSGQVAPKPTTNFPDVGGVQNPGTPFADPNAPAPAPSQQTPPAQADPFGSNPGSLTPEDATDVVPQPVQEDPFGSAPPTPPADAALPTEQAAPPTEPAPPEEDPFGDPPAEDPFGSEPTDDPPMEEDPFGDPPVEEPVEEDPFGEEKSEEPPMEEDPFGDDPVEEDPFGDQPPEKEVDADSKKNDDGKNDKKGGQGSGDKSPPNDPF